MTHRTMNLDAITPIDGRYQPNLIPLSDHFSEKALIKHRLMVEIEWFRFLSNTPTFDALPPLSEAEQQQLKNILINFDTRSAQQLKSIEVRCNHDVKAVEYYLRDQLEDLFGDRIELLHFACTSEDINNLAYACMIQKSLKQTVLPTLKVVIETLTQLARTHLKEPMLCRTHGQPATPSTIGKELANFIYRLTPIYKDLSTMQLSGKFNGATGNYNAHLAAYPNLNWLELSEQFVTSFGLNFQALSTQIEPRDTLAKLFDALQRIHCILLDLTQDCWQYISLDYLKLVPIDREVGSSTMPHKINPIYFENAEGNMGIANTLLHHFSDKLTRSRLQRDLSDSTVMRNIGSAFAYGLLAYQNLLKGLKQITSHTDALQKDLDQHWEILAEPIQTVMRKYRLANPYEQLKQITRHQQVIGKTQLHAFIRTLMIPDFEKERLLKLTPKSYLGLAVACADIVLR